MNVLVSQNREVSGCRQLAQVCKRFELGHNFEPNEMHGLRDRWLEHNGRRRHITLWEMRMHGWTGPCRESRMLPRNRADGATFTVPVLPIVPKAHGRARCRRIIVGGLAQGRTRSSCHVRWESRHGRARTHHCLLSGFDIEIATFA